MFFFSVRNIFSFSNNAFYTATFEIFSSFLTIRKIFESVYKWLLSLCLPCLCLHTNLCEYSRIAVKLIYNTGNHCGKFCIEN